jgi:uncharacterized protein
MTRSRWWLTQGGGRLEELDPIECRRLLDSTTIGRLGYVTESGPRIVPINFVVAADAVLFRTAPDNEIARSAVGQWVAFEVDQADEFLQSGWSVLAVGVAEQASEELIRMLDVGQTPEPWASGDRVLFVTIPLTSLTGRRVLPT